MHVGKITLDGDFNYGNKLQNYALQEFLLKYVERCDTVFHDVRYSKIPNPVTWGWKEIVKKLINWKDFRTKLQGNIIGRNAIRQYRFRRFDDLYIHTTYSFVDLYHSQLAQICDYIIVGSDQVWNPYFLENPEAMFLPFIEKDKRIAYAASFGISDIPSQWKDKYAKWIDEMHAISVRERRGAEIVKELTGRDVPVLVDPTMLLTTEEWNQIARKPLWLESNTPYILLYFLGEMPKEARAAVQKLAEEKHLAVIDLMDWHNLNWYTSDPAEFVYSIAHADLIYTDSFHGTVFSILYQRPFVICDRQLSDSEHCMNSRIDTLLSLFHFEERFGTEANHYALQDPMHIEYPDVEGILNRERERSADFLKQAMHLSQ